MNIEQYSPQSGRFLKEDGTYINIADALGGTETGQIADIEKHAAHSGRFIKEDGTCVNIADMIANGDIGSGGGSDSGSSDDSAPPIVETYNGQTIQCSMSADRPIKGLNLYATCEQKTTTGAQLFDGVFTVDTVLGTNGETSQYSGRSTTDFIKVKQSTDYTGFTRYLRACYYDAGKVFISYNDDDTVTRQTPEGCEYVRFCFINGSNVMFNEGSTALPYEPYTGRQPSPSPEYPQEIQTISDFVVEVKNSMGVDAMPQTLNITIPEQGFYGIPVSSGGNYTDASGKQWICDEFDFKNKKFIKRIGRVSFDGSEDEQWVRNITGENYQRFYVAFLNGNKNFMQCLCNRFIYASSAEIGTCFVANSTFYIYVEASIDTVALLRDYLNTHPLDVIYPLGMPVEYNLTDAEIEQYKKLRSYYGTTYIDNDAVPACNMQAELVLDTKLYIDNKFTTLAGQILEMEV